MVQATTDQIRAVADDLHDYFGFGLALANCIVVKIDGADRQCATIVSYQALLSYQARQNRSDRGAADSSRT
jgi:hypothetical protein